MDDSLLIKYEYNQAKGIDMHMLGESLLGFDAVLKDIIDIANLSGKVGLRVSRVEHGSVEVYNALVFLADVPFTNIHDFLDFLKIAAPHHVADANTFFSNINEVHRSVNDYFVRNQFDSAVVSGLVVAFLIGATDIAGKLYKNKIKVSEVKDIAPRHANRLRRMVEGGRYRRALSPIMSGEALSVQLLSVGVEERIELKLSQENVEDYIPDEHKVLPQLKNGQRQKFVGELVTLQSARSDEMKIRLHDVDPKNNLLRCVLGDTVAIEDYAKLFKKTVIIDAEVYRKTLYRKPELVVWGMEERQGEIV